MKNEECDACGRWTEKSEMIAGTCARCEKLEGEALALIQLER
jgi:hypothetical protein